jgi:hypothetical protein
MAGQKTNGPLSSFSIPFEILDGALVTRGLSPAAEGAEVPPLAALRIFLACIETVTP